MGLVKTVPDSLSPGSDVANLAAMGFDATECYTGRSPLEAISIGIDMAKTDIAFRCNLVTLSDDEKYAEKTMKDYSSQEITTAVCLKNAALPLQMREQGLCSIFFARVKTKKLVFTEAGVHRHDP